MITLRVWRGAEQAWKGVRKHRGGGGYFDARQYGKFHWRQRGPEPFLLLPQESIVQEL